MLQLTTLGATDLRCGDQASVEAVLSGPKRLALLAYLAVARPRGLHRRDVLIALLWPDADQDRGRATLRTTLYHLRRALGNEALLTRGDEEVGINRAVVSCDAVEFDRALDEGRTRAALELYHGDLLAGFFVSGAPEWEHWLAMERARLRTRAASAAWSLAEDAASAGMAEAANHWARRAFEIQPDDEGGLRRLITVLDQIGDRSGAITAYESFAQRLFAEYESEPAPETRSLIQSVRARVDVLAEPEMRERPLRKQIAAGHVPSSRHAMTTRLVAVLGTTLAVLVLAGFWALRPARPHPPVLAVGGIEVIGAPDSLSGFPVLLATNFARVPGLSVISEARMHEVLAALREGGGGRANLTHAAANAGATEIVEGTLSQRMRGGFRLDLRRVDVKSGATRGAFSIESTELFDLVDLATEWVADELGMRAPGTGYATTMSSLVAFQLYEGGLTAFYQNDRKTAERFLRTALAEDSTFAMAAYFLSRIVDAEESWRLLEMAQRHSARSTDRERLFIRAALTQYAQDPHGLAVAETLAVRYPAEPESHLMYARALIAAGAFAASVPHLERLIAMDSLPERGAGGRCWSCEAYARLADAYAMLDSFPAIERLARREIAVDPKSATAWLRLRSAYSASEQFDKALHAGRTAAQLAGLEDADFDNADALMRAGKFEVLENVWHRRLVTGDRDAREGAYYGQALQFRTQGRFRDALAAALQFRQLASQPPAPPVASIVEGNAQAATLMDMGRFAEAAALYDSIAAVRSAPTDSRHARHVAWTLSHAAGAYAALGDTVRLREIEDTVRVWGGRSAYMRDQLLHHYVRGLRLMALQDPGEAITAYRRALYSTTGGYSRINLQLGRAYMAVNRPRDAVAILEAGLRGPVGATGMYATRTELQAVLGEAYERIGDRDRAALQYRRVLHAWTRADPGVHPARERIRQRLAELQ